MANDLFAFIGTYTRLGSEGVYTLRMNGDTGELTQVSVATGLENPSFVALDPSGEHLYAVSETSGFDGSGGITAFGVNADSGELTQINQVSTGGPGPCHLMIDSTEANVIEEALQRLGGRSIVNSVNLEEGEERMDAVLLASKILNALDYVGVLGVELFVPPAGHVVNEIAPRVHNSGHWTQNGCVVDQFEQHIRAVAGWPLGDGARHADVVMENLIGEDMERVPELARRPDTALHLYGKAETRAGRKMGHANIVTAKST